eukprot:scaffold80881_cov63-Phaeocystis_antarctica.AAC.2
MRSANPSQPAGTKARVQRVHHPLRHAVKHDGAERLRVERAAGECRLDKLGASPHSLDRHWSDVRVEVTVAGGGADARKQTRVGGER